MWIIGTTYMTIVMALSIGMFGQVAIEKLLQSTGRTVFPMVTQMTGRPDQYFV